MDCLISCCPLTFATTCGFSWRSDVHGQALDVDIQWEMDGRLRFLETPEALNEAAFVFARRQHNRSGLSSMACSRCERTARLVLFYNYHRLRNRTAKDDRVSQWRRKDLIVATI